MLLSISKSCHTSVAELFNERYALYLLQFIPPNAFIFSSVSPHISLSLTGKYADSLIKTAFFCLICPALAERNIYFSPFHKNPCLTISSNTWKKNTLTITMSCVSSHGFNPNALVSELSNKFIMFCFFNCSAFKILTPLLWRFNSFVSSFFFIATALLTVFIL